MEEKQMNENKEQELKGKMGIVWLTGILVIILGCVTVYTLKLCKENKELKQKPQVQTQSVQQAQVQEEKTNTIAAKEETKKEVAKKEMTSEEKYKIFATNLKKAVSKYDSKEKTANVIGSRGDFPFEIELLSNGNLSIEFYDKKTNKKYGTKALAKNVLVVNVVEEGNGGYVTPYFICEDGTVGRANVDDSILKGLNKINVEYKVNKLKNIVSIVNGGGGFATGGAWSPIFIDIDGKIYK